MPEKNYARRIAVFYAALFLVYGVQIPYLPLWLDWRGLTPGEIAAVTAAPFFIRLLATPAAALYCDAWGVHRRAVIILSAAALFGTIVLSQMEGFWAILAVSTLFSISISTIMPLTEVIALSAVRLGGSDYGSIRLWGSLSFVAAGLGGGLVVDWLGAGIGVWLLAVCALATLIAAVELPKDMTGGPVTGHGSSRIAAREAAQLVMSPVFLVFILGAGAIMGAHGTFYTFGVVHLKSQGLSTLSTGILWAIAVLAEVAVFAYAGRYGERAGTMRLLIAGGAASVVRWVAMTFDPGLPALVLLQALHGLTYGAAHLGAIQFMATAVPQSAAGTAQALYATMAAGCVIGAVTLASGPLYATYKGGAYWVAAGTAALGLLAMIWVARRWEGGPLWVSPTVPEAAAR